MPRVQSEYEVETIFIDRLQDVVDNFRKQLAKFNSEKLIEVKGDDSFSDAEFNRIMIHVDNKSVYEWKVPIFLDTLSMGQLILPTVHYRRHF